MNKRWVTLLGVFTLAFGGSATSKIVITEDDHKQTQIDSLTAEMRSVTREIDELKGDVKVLKEVVSRVEADNKARSQKTTERLEKLEEKQDRIIALILSLKK